MLSLKGKLTVEDRILDLMIELKTADRYFLETGEQWEDLDNIQQRRLIDSEREALGKN